MSLEDSNTEWEDKMSAQSLHIEFEVKEEWESEAEEESEDASAQDGSTLYEMKEEGSGESMRGEAVEAQCVKVEAKWTSDDACDLSAAGEDPERAKGGLRCSIEHELIKRESASKDVSVAAAMAGLYTGHTVKDELVVGPEDVQQPKQLLANQGSSGQIEKNEPMTTFTMNNNSQVIQSIANQEKNERHKRAHTLYKCAYCSYISAYKSNLQEHEMSHKHKYSTQTNSEKSFMSAYSSFASAYNNKKLHTKAYADEKLFKCTFCNYASAYKNNLLSHNKIHIYEKLYKCSQCSFGTDFKSNLRHHEKAHADDKTYKCAHCSYTTAVKSDIKVHQRTHSGERPYKCVHCSYASAYKSNLRSH